MVTKKRRREKKRREAYGVCLAFFLLFLIHCDFKLIFVVRD